FALDLAARMHQTVGELARVGEKQQAPRVEVEPSDRDPVRAPKLRQIAEHRRPARGIARGDELARGLVIEEHPRLLAGGPQVDRLPVDEDAVARLNALAQRGARAVYRDPTRGDGGLHLAPRAEPRPGEDFVQSFRGSGARRRSSGPSLRTSLRGSLRAGRAPVAGRARGSA